MSDSDDESSSSMSVDENDTMNASQMDEEEEEIPLTPAEHKTLGNECYKKVRERSLRDTKNSELEQQNSVI